MDTAGLKGKIEKKLYSLSKLAIILSILMVFVTGLIKYIWGVDWFDISVSKKLSSFFLFKYTTVQNIIMQASLVLNILFMLAIVLRKTLKEIIKRLGIILIPLSFFIHLDKELGASILMVAYILLVVLYESCWGNQIKGFWKTAVRILLKTALSILALLFLYWYQLLTIGIRLNIIPELPTEYGFYPALIYVIDMHILSAFIYKYNLRRGWSFEQIIKKIGGKS